MIMLRRDSQEIVQDFNDNEAVWRAFNARKRLRELLGTPIPLDEERADALDWQLADREARPARAIGGFLP